MPRLERAQAVDLVVVGGLALLALALRLPLLRDSLLGDELIMYGIVHDRGLGDVLSVVRDTEKTPPLHFALAWVTARIGDSTWSVRLPSLLSGIALVPLGYALGLRTAGRAAGLVAAAILALQPYSMFYATEARAYALVALLAGLSTLCLLRALDTRSRWWWAAYVLAVLGVAYTHYIGIFVLAAQAGWAFWVHRDRLRELATVHALIVLAIHPVDSLVPRPAGSQCGRGQAYCGPRPAVVEYFARANAQVAFGQPFATLRDVPGSAAAVLAVLVLAAALVAAGVRAWRRDPPGARMVLVILLALATPLGIAALSLPGDRSFLLPRNLIASLPALAVLIGWLLVALRSRLAVAAAAAFLLVLAVGAAHALDPSHRRSPYRDAAHLVDAWARPGDPVIQRYFLPVEGALHRAADQLRATPPAAPRGGASEAAAWERGRRTGRVYEVVPLAGVFKRVRHAGRLAGPEKEFDLRREAELHRARGPLSSPSTRCGTGRRYRDASLVDHDVGWRSQPQHLARGHEVRVLTVEELEAAVEERARRAREGVVLRLLDRLPTEAVGVQDHREPGRACSCVSSTMSLVNWWMRNSFSGRLCCLTSCASHAEVALTSRAPTAPITVPGTWPGCIRHSGSSASPTSGCSSHLRSRTVSVKKSERPGWMSRISSALARRAARR